MSLLTALRDAVCLMADKKDTKGLNVILSGDSDGAE
jgi:hypothetical protein